MSATDVRIDTRIVVIGKTGKPSPQSRSGLCPTIAVWAKKTYLLYVERGAGLSYLEVLLGVHQQDTEFAHTSLEKGAHAL